MNRRQTVRYRTRIQVEIQARGEVFGGYILDVSEGGLRVSTERVADVWAGDPVEIRSKELGLLTGTARWRNPGMFGLKFDDSTNTAAKVEHFRKFLGPRC
jgi:hypothetical protein